MTLREYSLRMKAHELRRADKLADYAQLAIFMRDATLHDAKGRFGVQKVEDLYSAKKVEDAIFEVERIREELTFTRLRALSKIIKEHDNGRKP